MTEIIRNRTIRPSSRLEKSKSYKIDTKQISRGEILVVNINYESKPFHKTYKFNGSDLASKDSISFRVNDFGTTIEIIWSGAQPIGTVAKNLTSTLKQSTIKVKANKIKTVKSSVYLKTS